MKKYFNLGLAILFCCQFAAAQKASDVLENGIPIKSGKVLFLKFENKKLNYAVAWSKENPKKPISPIPLGDSTIFLVSNTALPVYLLPLNPLNFSTSAENKIVTDPINEAILNALKPIFDMLDSTTGKLAKSGNELNNREATSNNLKDTICPEFKEIVSKIDSVQKKLKDSKKSDAATVFKRLQALSFLNKKDTRDSLVSINSGITEITRAYKAVKDLIDSAQKLVNKYPCTNPQPFIAKYVFNNVLKDLTVINEEQQKRIKALDAAWILANEMQKRAAIGGGENGLRWCILLDNVPATEGKISVCKILINDPGNSILNGEIVSGASKEVLNKTIKIRRFQRFVPEVSVGTAYTRFTYNTFGTTTNSDGKMVVAQPTENTMRNLKFTTMINFNYYISHSQIHPLWQIGIGVNSDAPTLLTGLGLRLNINGVKRMALTGGIAMTWLKELDKLKVGDKVSGTDDINKDLKYQFSWPPKPYIGIQYNF